MLKQLITIFIIGIVGVLGASQTSAQGYKISGRVTDADTGEPLPGASITVNDSKTGTVTDIHGRFVIENIRQDSVVLDVNFVSYEASQIPCRLQSGSPLELQIKLKPASTTLTEVSITGQSEGQVKAMIEQRVAANIKNVVSAEQIKLFPDMNAAEVMQRIPGITVQRDQGEGKYVQLRGTPPELTNFNVNGEQISSPEGDVRYVGMDIISADQIDFIEVTKVLTPDMDADGIAGNVNIITKRATVGDPELSTTLAGGYNNLMGTGNYQAQFAYGYRHKKIGFQTNANYYVNNQGSHNMEYDYTRGPTLEQSQSGDSTLGAENFHLLYSDIEYRHYTITRKRTGLSANLDYRPTDKTTFYLRGMYNLYSDYELRRRVAHELTDANTPFEYRSTDLQRDVRQRNKIQEISTINLGATHELPNNAALDYEVSFSRAADEVPDYMYAAFDRGLIGLRIDKSNPEWPVVHYINEEDSLNAHNYESYEFDKLSLRSSMVVDQNYSAKLNLTIPYTIGSNQKGFLKIGGKVRFKTKERDNDARVYSEYEKSKIYSQPAPPLELTDIADTFDESNLLDHGYHVNVVPDADKIADFYQRNLQHFKYDEQESWEDKYQEDYTAYEDIYAVYAMLKHDIGKLMILAGLRYETTDVRYKTQNAWLELEVDSLRGLLRTGETKSSRNIPFLLPQVQLKYAVNDRTNIRLAGTYTYSRPSFEDILPYRIEDEEGNIKKGNPELDYPLALNIDFLAETYLPDKGILSGGLYYKRIDNFVFKFVRKAHEGENFNRYGLKEITMPVNGIHAFVYGAELQTQFKFSFFSGFPSDFGFFGNYTYTESDAIISKRYPQNENDVIYRFDSYESDFFTSSEETETIPLPGQAKHTANAALFYDAEKLYIKLSANYHSPFLTELGNDSGLDMYYDQAWHFDFTANYQITPRLNCFIDVVNLTNAPLRYYMGSTDYFKQQEYYSSWGRVGLRLNL